MRYVIVLLLVLLAACSGDDKVSAPESVDQTITPTNFIQPLNKLHSLAAGPYEVVVATASAGVSANYSLSIVLSSGETTSFEGSWTNSVGQVYNDSENPSHSFQLREAGGVSLTLESDVDAYIYLLKNGQLLAEQGGSQTVELNLDASQINSEAYARAYYQAVDPDEQRTTLASWKSINGFDQGYDNHVVFRDVKDLGYGRDMYQRENDDGSIAIFVNNYVVKVFEGSSDNYGPMNVEAAIEQQQKHYVGTNAIEFSPIDPNDPNSDKVVKFFIFVPEEGSQDVPRAIAADLDGRGVKYMPTTCYSCHARIVEGLEADGTFSDFSQKAAKLNLLEVSEFEFSTQTGFNKADQQQQLKQINQAIYQVNQAINLRSSAERGKWSGDYSQELGSGSYNAFNRATYDESYVPSGWQANSQRPENVEQLFLEVVKPHCFSCHSQQGSLAGELITEQVNGVSVSLANAINFSSYEKFISYNDRIIDYVYKRGVMPLSLRNFEAFWAEGNNAPVLLASFLLGFDRLDGDRNILPPGYPFAKPGDDRAVSSPVQLNASASLFASSYQWQLLSAPVGAQGSFDDATIAAPVFSANLRGDYVLELTVSNALGEHSEKITLAINDGQFKSQQELTFVDDILPILGSETFAACASCHNDGLTDSAVEGIPVFYDSSNPQLYRQVLARVDFADPENSLLLRKPTGVHHGGGVRIDRNTATGSEQYNTLLNWIREGAVCGDSNQFC